MSKYNFHVVSHTHWDREWHLPFERFRIALVEVIDRVLDLLENNPSYKYFMLDGQTIVIDDYLEIKPGAEVRLRRLVKKGKLSIGPWYVLADMFLPSGEALIRNLLLGKEISERMGGRTNCGYLPDVFGFSSQIPQILRGFNLDNAQIYRGVGSNITSTEFFWESPDGSKVLTVYLPSGYYNFNLDGLNVKKILEKANNAVELMVKWSTTKHSLMMNGTDHYYADGNLPDKLAMLSKNFPNGKFLHSTLEEYVKSVKEEIKTKNIQLRFCTGEFRENRPARITPGVISTRIYLKQANAKVQTLLERYTEPLSVFSFLSGSKYDREILKQEWKYLIQNHPHDSICGCSVDEVHSEMMNRFSKAEQISQGLIQRSINFICKEINTGKQNGIPLVVFNTLQFQRKSPAKCKVFLPFENDFDLIDSKGKSIPIKIINQNGVNLKYVYQYERWSVASNMAYQDGTKKIDTDIANSKDLELAYSSDDPAASLRYFETDLEFVASDIPSLGWKTYYIVKRRNRPVGSNIKSGKDFIENEFYRLKVDRNGRLILLDKLTHTVFKNINYFVNGSDAGDEYNYSPAVHDKIFCSTDFPVDVEIESYQPVKVCIHLRYRMRLPKSLSDDRRTRDKKLIDFPVETVISLYPGIKRVEFETVVDNTVKDHRLRVAFNTPIHAECSYALNPFDCVKRKIFISEEAKIGKMQINLEAGEELEVASFPQSGFIDISDESSGLCLIAEGIPEYEILPGKNRNGVTMQLTLIRAVGWLSRSDLITRKGNAGPTHETPDAQCIGVNRFSYAITSHKGMPPNGKIVNEFLSHNTPVKAVQTYSHKGHLSSVGSFFEISGEGVVLSALKLSEERESVVIRLYNITDKITMPVISSMLPIKQANMLNLQEDVLYPIKVKDGKIQLEISRKKIVTLEIFI